MNLITAHTIAMAQRVEERKAEAKNALHPVPTNNRERAKLLPMRDRVQSVLAAFTPEELAQGIKLEAVCDRLQGKYRGRAQAGEVGKALRQLSFVRVRNWRATEEGFRTLWHLPLTNTNKE